MTPRRVRAARASTPRERALAPGVRLTVPGRLVGQYGWRAGVLRGRTDDGALLVELPGWGVIRVAEEDLA